VVSGRLQILRNADAGWSVVQQREFTDSEARVACEQIAKEAGMLYKSGRKDGNYRMTNAEKSSVAKVSCGGSESRLQDCGWDEYTRGNGVKVECKFRVESCESCGQGKHSFSDATGSTTCVPCEKGKYSNERGATECSMCLEGRYSGSPGSVACDACPTGRYSAKPSMAECDACPSGRYSDVQGASACKTCDSGHYGNEEAYEISSCEGMCHPGTYSVGGAESCSACPAGMSQKSSPSSFPPPFC
jgi:hypothetical protein